MTDKPPIIPTQSRATQSRATQSRATQPPDLRAKKTGALFSFRWVLILGWMGVVVFGVIAIWIINNYQAESDSETEADLIAELKIEPLDDNLFVDLDAGISFTYPKGNLVLVNQQDDFIEVTLANPLNQESDFYLVRMVKSGALRKGLEEHEKGLAKNPNCQIENCLLNKRPFQKYTYKVDNRIETTLIHKNGQFCLLVLCNGSTRGFDASLLELTESIRILPWASAANFESELEQKIIAHQERAPGEYTLADAERHADLIRDLQLKRKYLVWLMNRQKDSKSVAEDSVKTLKFYLESLTEFRNHCAQLGRPDAFQSAYRTRMHYLNAYVKDTKSAVTQYESLLKELERLGRPEALQNAHRTRTQLLKAVKLTKLVLAREEPILKEFERVRETEKKQFLDLYLLRNDVYKHSAENRFSDAFKLNKKVLEFAESLGANSYIAATSWLNQGALQFELGHTIESLNSYKRSIQIYDRLGLKEHPDRIISENGLGKCLMDLGEHVQARDLLKSTFAKSTKTFGPSHQEYGHSTMNFANALMNMGDIDQATQLYKQAVANYSQDKSGRGQSLSARAISKYAVCLSKSGQDSDAAIWMEKALAILKSLPGQRRYVDASLNYIPILFRAGKFQQAKQYLINAIDHFEKESSPFQKGTSEHQLASMLFFEGKFEESLKYLNSSRRGLRNQLVFELPGLSALPRAETSFHEQVRTYQALSMAIQKRNDQAWRNSALEWVVNSKAVLHEAESDLMRLAQESKSKSIQSLARELENDRFNPTLDPKSIDERRMQLGSEMSKESNRDRWVTLPQLRQAIGEETAFICFQRISVLADHQAVDPELNQAVVTDRYIALVLNGRNGSVSVHQLPENELLEDLIDIVRDECYLEDEARAKRMILDRMADKEDPQPIEKQLAGFKSAVREASELLIHEILADCRGCSKLIISPDDKLWSVPWAALTDSDQSFLAEKYEIKLSVSGRGLVNTGQQDQNGLKTTASLIFHPSFSSNPNAKSQSGLREGIDFVSDLPGSRDEGERIEKYLRENQCEVTVLSGEKVTKNQLRELQNPGLLFLSTHGFLTSEGSSNSNVADKIREFIDGRIPDQAQLRKELHRQRIGDPLENCGLILSAYNDLESTEKHTAILNGREATLLKLNETRLVVLSACSTAFGDSSQGTAYGSLNNSFLIAGAKEVMGTLWKIDDESTAKFNPRFLAQYLDGDQAANALVITQRTFLNQANGPPESQHLAHPFFWSCFTVTTR